MNRPLDIFHLSSFQTFLVIISMRQSTNMWYIWCSLLGDQQIPKSTAQCTSLLFKQEDHFVMSFLHHEELDMTRAFRNVFTTH